MINIDSIKRLSKITSKKEDIITVYLNTNQKDFTTSGEIKIKLKDLTAKIRERGFEKDAKIVEEQFKKIDQNGTRLIVVIISASNNILEVMKFNVKMKSQVHIKDKVYVPPLLRILDEYERYCVALVDKKQKKIFTVYMGEFEELKEASQEFPGHHAQGGWSQARFQRHVEEHAKKMMKKAAKEVYRLWKKHPFDRLIIGGSKEIMSEFTGMLHKDLQSRVADKIACEMFLSDDELLKRSLEIEEKIEREKEKELVKKLEDNLGYDNRAVRGLDKVIKEFEEGKVMQLLIESTYSEVGKKCKKCGHMSIGSNSCEFCGGDTEYIDDIVAELASEAINRGAVVEYVRNSEGMKRNKNIGAFLRF